jgi:tRNA(fMet)-specific endonuclease VapC
MTVERPLGQARYLLDTNIVSDLVRRSQDIVAKRVAEIGEQAVCTSIVAAAELRFGSAKAASTRFQQQVDAVLGALPVLPLDIPVDRHYGEIRHCLEQSGQSIGPNDLLIAAHAAALDLILVSANLREF